MTDAVIVHQLPGRIRIRVPAMRGVEPYFSELGERLRMVDSVQTVKANPATGSILVHFGGDSGALLERLHELDLHPQIKSDTPDVLRHSPLPVVRLVSGREIDPLFMAGCVLATIGLAQTVRGKILVPSVTAFWYALEAFRAALRGR